MAPSTADAGIWFPAFVNRAAAVYPPPSPVSSWMFLVSVTSNALSSREDCAAKPLAVRRGAVKLQRPISDGHHFVTRKA